MRRLTTLAAACVGLAAAASPAHAVTYGSPDGSGHPNVGGLVASQPYSDGTSIYCSGTLIAPRVFLTAAHCDEGTSQVHVTFDTAYEVGDKTYSGTFHGDPAYNQTQSDPHDIAVVVLDKDVKNIAPARLPRAGQLSSLPKGQPLTAVGYGAYAVTSGPGGHRFLYDDVRMVATGTLDAVNPAWLRISMNPATGDGGGCYGDSGGPNFLGSTDIVAATTITGDAICRATNVAYRLDTASARTFLRPYVRLP